MTVRARQAALLLRPLARAVPWWPVGAGAAVSALAVLPVLLQPPGQQSGVAALRLAAAVLGAGASFALADRMAPMTVAPTPRWLRQWLRVGLVVPPAAVCWLALYLTLRARLGAQRLGPGADVAAEALVCALVGVAAAAVAARVRHTATGALAGPVTQGGLAAGSLFVTGDRSPWAVPGSAGWPTVHRFWWTGVAVLVLVLVVANRELWWPARRRRG